MARQYFAVRRTSNFYVGTLGHEEGKEISYRTNSNGVAVQLYRSTEEAQSEIDRAHENWAENGYHCQNGEAGRPSLEIAAFDFNGDILLEEELSNHAMVDFLIEGRRIFTLLPDSIWA